MRILCTVPPIPTCSDEARKNPRATVGRPASVLRSQVSCASIQLSRNPGHLSCSAFRLSCLFASILFPFNPSFSPFAVNRLPRHPAPCYHWPMSARTSNPPPAPPHNRTPVATTQFPKWNGRHHSAVLPARHSPALSAVEGSLACPDGGRATRHCLSNRNTPKLEFPVTHTKQSLGQFLIATFRAFATIQVQCWFTLRNEGPPLSSGLEAQKLENLLTGFYSATSKFLIDNFQRDLGHASIKGLAGARSVLFSSRSPLATRHCFPRLIEFLWEIRN